MGIFQGRKTVYTFSGNNTGDAHGKCDGHSSDIGMSGFRSKVGILPYPRGSTYTTIGELGPQIPYYRRNYGSQFPNGCICRPSGYGSKDPNNRVLGPKGD